jgi:amino acid adenylation domain-containing protein
MSSEPNQTGLEIAVIGMAGRFPGAQGIEQFWENLKNGVESIHFYTDEELIEAGVDPGLLENPNYVRSGGGMLEGKEYFDASFFGYSVAEAELMDPQLRVFHECAWTALENAGYEPFSYSGLIGLYAGASFNFFWEALAWFSGKTEVMGEFASMLLIDRDYLCTRVSYNLDLKGPSVIVKTACSTSLVALHLACQGILNGECDMALAGGVTITRLTDTGYLYEEGMVRSPDGHCRAFDAKAKGFIGGDGVGIVVLKRLEDALKDGDYIHAVIKGTAINNDGIRKVGYTAPSVVGQADVIIEAQQVAEVDPVTITYVETHGTGTAVGDPIEIEALKMAFDTDKKRFCGIGSIKTNFGHLDSAAGAASLIKTILALKHQLIPPSLHFETSNPKIDFENSPFYVNAKLSEWKRDGYPLRAGVSSFGIGGTNAHIVLEEGPEQEPSSESRTWKLLLLSTKTRSALERTTENLAEFLKKNPGINLADTAYTLQVGRCAFPHRRMAICSDVDSAFDALSSTESGKHPTFCTKEENTSVIFMFSGLGSQYVNMGGDLYHTEPVFREEMDRCFEILKPIMGYNIKGILYREVRDVGNKHATSLQEQPAIPVSDLQPSAGSEKINHIEIAQIVVFILEYSLAKLLMKWGIKPHAMIGYSFGEYTAACLSGVFSLEDALNLVVIRGQLIARISGGSMMSVPLTINQLTPLMNNELSIAIDNGPSCIVSGPVDAVGAFEKQLREKRLLCMKLPNSHAIHSKMMEPILNEFGKSVGEVTLNRPKIPYISNVTGKWITVQEATDPAYWTKHLRETVRFAGGIDELKKEPNPVFVEIGPGRDLRSLLVRHKEEEEDSKQQAVNLIRPQQQDVPDDRYLLSKIGQLWLYGITIDWQAIYADERRHRIPLPTYSFDRQRYWFEGNLFQLGEEMLTSRALFQKKKDIADWFYIPQWTRSALSIDMDTEVSGNQNGWLLFMGESALGTHLVERLKRDNPHVTIVRAGLNFEALAEHEYTINPSDANDYNRLFEDLVKSKNVPGNIVHLWCLTGSSKRNPGAKCTLDALDWSQDLGLYSLLYIAQAVGKNGIFDDMQIGVVTDNMQPVTGEEELCPEKATLLGPIKVIPLEYSNIKCLSIDIVNSDSNEQQMNFIADRLIKEFSADFSDYQMVAYRGTYRWIESFESIRLDNLPSKKPVLKEKGVYLVTGGFGGMGFVLAEHLAQRLNARLILVDMLDLPLKEGHDQWLTSDKRKKDIHLKMQKIKKLEENGAEIQIHNADVSDYLQMKEAISKAEERFGKIDGVIHTAGLIDYSGIIQRRSRQMTDTILDAKVRGVLVLDELLKNHELDFMVLFSSIGNVFHKLKFGQVGYNAGHEFMDVFSYHKQKQGRRVVTIDWNDWMKVGMAVRAIEDTNGAEMTLPGVGDIEDILSISPSQGIDVFHRIVANDFSRVIVFACDLVQMLEYMNRPSLEEEATVDVFESRVGTEHLHERPELDTPYIPPSNQIEQTLANTWQKFFGINQVGIEDDFFELGGDSLSASTVIARIHRELDVLIPLPEFFRRPTIKNLAIFVAGDTGENIYSSIEPVEKREYYPLSSAQRRLYVLWQFDDQGIGYNTPFVSTLEGSIDKNKFEDTFKRLIMRHESLRTSFHIIGELPVQKISEDIAFEINYFDLTGDTVGPRGEMDGKVKEVTDHFIRPFNLSHAPLFRVGLIKQNEDMYFLVLDMHHIVSDGTSVGLLIRDFMALYGGDTLSDLRVQYKDFSDWHNSKEVREFTKNQADYWIKEFEGEIPILNLPTDFPRPVIQSFEGGVAGFEIGEEHTVGLRERFTEEGTTMFMILMAVFNVLLSKRSDQEDIVVGVPIAGRSHSDLEQIAGVFINTLPMRNFPKGEKKFKTFLGEVKDRSLEALSNQDYPYEELVERVAVERDAGRNPLFDVIFIMQNYDLPAVEIPGLKLRAQLYDQGTSIADHNLMVFESEKRLWCILTYCTMLFKPATIEKFINHFKKLIAVIIENPTIKISDVDIVTEEEKRQVLLDFNNTTIEFPEGNKTIHELFEQQVETSSDRLALIFKDHQVTYGELNKKANQLARLLRTRGIQSNDIVGLIVERSIEMIIGIIAILKAGAAYLPVDLEYPVERKKYMLEDSSVKLVLTNFDSEGDFDYIMEEIEIIDLRDENIYHGTIDNPEHINEESDMLYLIYTSGSTGRPKGVVLQHINLVNLLLFSYEFTNLDFSTILQFTTISFDVSFQEIFSALLAGGRLYLIDKEIRSNIQELFKIVEKNKIKTLFLPMSLLKVIFSEEEYIRAFPSCVRHIPTAGEQVVISDTFGEYLRDKHIYLHNHYGPSEAHVVTTLTLEPDAEIHELPPIGKPVSNTGIYIMDKYGHLQPIGVPGELYIGGIQVGRGYLNRPEITAERFTYLPTGERIYRTGDLARWLSDGNIDFLGRIDHQVKLRGFRIELGEIESQLLKHEGIREVVVIAGEKEDKYLCAYIVSESEPSVSKLKGFLSDRLPEYMIPAYFVVLERIPLTPNGKVDRKALPEPESEAGTEEVYTAPRNTVESRLVNIWSEILGIEEIKISIDSNFFALGGHSLRATVMGGKVHKELNAGLPLAEIFKTPTIRGLSEYIKGVAKDKHVSIEPAEKKEYYPLSSAQRRLYILQRVDDQGITYNLPFATILEGSLDKNRFEDTFRWLIRRHASLRTSFEKIKEEPVQKIHENVAFKIEYHDITDIQTEAEVKEIIKHFVRPFDLSQAPLFRVGLIKKDADAFFLVVDMHHIISDGVSIGLLVREFMVFYSGEALPEPRLEYKDFSQWQNSKEVRVSIQQQEAYWLNEFEDEIPVLDLPTDFTRPVIQSFEGKRLSSEIDKENTTALRTYALGEGTTLFTVLLTVYNIFLFKFSGKEDVVVGSPIAGRRHSDLEDIVGMFVNTLSLRNFPSGEKTFKQFLEEVKDRTLDAFSNQDYLYEELVESVEVTRDTGRNPVFDVAFILQNMDIPEIDIPGLKLKPYIFEQGISKFDLTLEFIEIGEILRCNIEYSTKLFKTVTIERFTAYLRKIISIVVESPGIKIADIEITSEEEKQHILYDFNDTAREYPKDKTIHQLFEEQVERTPHLVGAGFTTSETGTTFITYGELNKKSNQLAHLLMGNGVEPGAIVGIMTESSVEMIIGLLAILKIGGAYLPVNPDYPEERKRYLLEDGNVSLLLTNHHQVVPADDDREIIYLEDPDTYDIEMGEREGNGENGGRPDDLAYIIYTSGSTGGAKGVIVEHRSVIRLVKNSNYIQFNRGDRILQTGALEFDASTFEIWGALLNGLELYLAPRDILLAPAKLKGIIRSREITTIWMTAPLFNQMVDADIEIFAGLHHLLVGGDILSPLHINRVRNHFPKLQVINGYGPTENTTFSTTFAIHKDYSRNIPIGSPIANSTAYIVNKYNRLVPIGVHGELLVGGDGVSRGYLNNPELTNEKFLEFQEPFYKKILGRRRQNFYRTGDVTRWLSDGNIEFLGRIDFQVKIRGFRIELGEIENRLLEYPDVKETVVLARETEAGEKYLCAYLVALKELSTAEIRQFLSKNLPDYMIPSYFMPLEKIPLTSNGKVDRRALPAPEIKTETIHKAPENEIEAKLVEIWAEVLRIEKDIISTDRNFFELGGHSLRATLLAARIHKELNVELPLLEVFTSPTVHEMAQWIATAGKILYAPIPAVEKKEYYDLTHAQERVWTMSQVEAASIAFNIPMLLFLEGKLDIQAFERTFAALVERHESFRTAFITIDGEPKQRILPLEDVGFNVQYLKLEGDREKETKTHQRVEQETVRPFDLTGGLLLCIMLIRLEEERHMFFLNMHHIISDYLSFDVFIEEMLILYNKFIKGESNLLAPLRIQYKDYTAWHNEQLQGEQLNDHREYWLSRLEGRLPRLELPLDKERPAVQTYNGDMMVYVFEEVFFEKLKDFSEAHNVTLFMTLLTALNLLFYHYTGQTDIIVGSIIAGREHADLRGQVGYYLNTLALRTSFDSGATFTGVLDNVRTILTEAYQHQVYPFDRLVEDLGGSRDRTRHPIFDVVVDMLNYNADHEETLRQSSSGNIRVEEFDIQTTTTKFDLTIYFMERAHRMDIRAEYNTDLFERRTIERMMERFRKLLDTVLEQPNSAVSGLQLEQRVQAPIIQRISREA